MPIRELDRALRDVERILLDSSVLIAYHDPRDQTYLLADYLLNRVASGDDPLRAYISVVSASEILVRPLRTSRADFRAMYAFLTTFPNLQILPTDLPIALHAATLRATTNIRLPDALVVAAGVMAGCEAIVGNDVRWKTRLAPLYRQFRWVHLGDHV